MSQLSHNAYKHHFPYNNAKEELKTMKIKEDKAFKIDNLNAQGLSLREIEKELNISKSTIGRYLSGKVGVLLNEVSPNCPQSVPSSQNNQNIEVSIEDLEGYKDEIIGQIQELKKYLSKEVTPLIKGVDYLNKYLWAKDNNFFKSPVGALIHQKTKDLQGG